MPGQPSPTSSTSSGLDELHSNSSGVDSLAGESCDDLDTMHIPDAVVQVSPSKQSQRSKAQESTDGPTDLDSGDPFEESPANETEDDIGEKWNPSLYMLQSQCPNPVPVASHRERTASHAHYGQEYHGVLDKYRAGELLGNQDGAYLVRDTPKGATILSFMLDQRAYNFRLFYEDGLFFVGDKRFDSVDDVVQDGLITLYLQKHDVAKVMEEGRNNTMLKSEKARKLRRRPGKRVRGLKGKAAWSYSRSTSASSVCSMDVHPASSSKGNSPSPNLSRSPSPIPILQVHSGPVPILDDGSSMRPMSSPESSPSPVRTVPIRNKSLSPDVSNLIIDLEEGGSRSAPQTPLLPLDHLSVLVMPVTPPDDFSSLEFKSQRRSAPSLPGDTVHAKRSLGVSHRSPLTARRVQSASSIQQDTRTAKERRTTIIKTLRSAVLEDKRHTKSTPELKKAATLGTYTKSTTYTPFCERSNSCTAAVANTLERVADYSIKGPSTLSRSSLAALAKHTSGPRSPYSKAHNFEMHTYMAPTWCEICHNFLWGLKQQGMQCKDCGMDIHKQCLPLAIQLQCFPNKAFVKRVYGVDLTTLVKLEGGLVPSILAQCIKELESRQLTSRGIYRVSGHSTEILELKDKFDQGEKIDFSQYEDENIITGVIKLYLRELPIPLITFDSYKSIIKATAGVSDPENEATDWKPLTNALLHLPKAHYNTLKHLVRHLHRVDSQSDENKMTALNLAVVFAPTLMRSPSEVEDHSLLKDLPLQKTFIEYLISYHDTLFKS